MDKKRVILFSAGLLLSASIATQFRDRDRTLPWQSQDRQIAVVESVRSQLADEALKQSSNDLEKLYQQAAIAQPYLSLTTQELARELGGEALIPPTLKTRERSLEKIATDYDGDASRITDLARSSIIFETEAEVLKALSVLQQRTDVLRFKNRFASPIDGYRDVLLNVLTPNGHIVEIQLHLRSILEAKYESGDGIYSTIRTIEGDAKREGRSLTTSETMQIQELRTKARKLYNDAFAKSKM